MNSPHNMKKKQLEISIDNRIDLGLFIGVYPEIGFLLVLPFISIAMRDRYGDRWFRFVPKRSLLK